jgi:uncharacterized membrane protein
MVFAVASVHSTVFIMVHAGHKHAHSDYDGACAVCAHLAAAGSLIKSFSPPVAGAPKTNVFSIQSPTVQTFACSYDNAESPVLLKVKLNN